MKKGVSMKHKAKSWKDVLTEAELKHLRIIKAVTKKAFINTNNIHNHYRKQKEGIEPCYQCVGIAEKLGLEVYRITKPYGSENLNTFKIDKGGIREMRPVIEIKSSFRRRLILCLVFPPCVAIALISDAFINMYKEFNSEMIDTFTHTWKGRDNDKSN